MVYIIIFRLYKKVNKQKNDVLNTDQFKKKTI